METKRVRLSPSATFVARYFPDRQFTRMMFSSKLIASRLSVVVWLLVVVEG